MPGVRVRDSWQRGIGPLGVDLELRDGGLQLIGVRDPAPLQTNQRGMMDEAALFTVENGKIVREEFFYTGG